MLVWESPPKDEQAKVNISDQGSKW